MMLFHAMHSCLCVIQIMLVLFVAVGQKKLVISGLDKVILTGLYLHIFGLESVILTGL